MNSNTARLYYKNTFLLIYRLTYLDFLKVFRDLLIGLFVKDNQSVFINLSLPPSPRINFYPHPIVPFAVRFQ